MKKKSKKSKRSKGSKRSPSSSTSSTASTLDLYRKKRDFKKTPEPAAARARPSAGTRRFVVHKHAARRTHFDLRLEWGGTLKSWAVPKGPSLDPKEKRLAVHVEDHPLEYGKFEGRIPQGEYGAGPVIIWDHGTYVPIYPSEDATDDELEDSYRDGKVEFEIFGERMRGKWGLIRMRGSAPGDRAGKEPWLLIKKKDPHASATRDVVAEYRTSVVSGLTLREIDEGGQKAKKRTRAEGPGAVAAEAPDFQPMLAERAERLPESTGYGFEEKIDGVRVIVRAGPADVRLLSRTGQRLEAAFPEVAEAVRRMAERAGASFVLDGELAVRDARGRPRFAEIQPRINLRSAPEIERWAKRAPAELFLFDCLWANGLHFAERPLRERRAALAELARFGDDRIHVLSWWEDRGEEVWARAQEERWEGVMAKRCDSRYLSGRRSREWTKIKLVNQEELILVGWTDPDGSRAGFGALLLGYHDDAGDLRFAGRVGTGFDAAALETIAAQLRPLERKTSPCIDPPDEKGLHWVAPRLVAMIKFHEWTKDRRLRAPVFLGLRHDKPASEVRITEREIAGAAAADLGPPATPELDALLAGLERMEATGKDQKATVDGVELTFTNLAKILFPEDGVTKGDLLRYYARVSPWLLPALEERPLHLERYPDGIEGERFWQQRAPSPVPAGIPTLPMEDDGEEIERLVGGSLATLLYTTQLAAIPQHPWPSRVDSLEFMDYTILDLDPGPDVGFDVVRDVARWTRDELDRLDLTAVVKTSGGRGLHVVLPLGPGATYTTGRLLTQLVAALVQRRHLKVTTLERSLKKRPTDKVYLDCFQNEYGKTIASVYSVRPRAGAPVSTPLRWEELDADLDPLDFRVRDIWDRFRSVGDLWAPARERANRVEEVIERLEAASAKKTSRV